MFHYNPHHGAWQITDANACMHANIRTRVCASQWEKEEKTERERERKSPPIFLFSSFKNQTLPRGDSQGNKNMAEPQ